MDRVFVVSMSCPKLGSRSFSFKKPPNREDLIKAISYFEVWPEQKTRLIEAVSGITEEKFNELNETSVYPIGYPCLIHGILIHFQAHYLIDNEKPETYHPG